MDRVDRAWYEESGYFEAAKHLRALDSPFQRYRAAKVLELFGPAAGDRVLDLGCGWGTISFALSPRVLEVVGIDYAEAAIAECEANLQGLGCENVSFRVGDARETRLPGASFDGVVAADLFEHLYPADSVAVANEAFRVLRPGGRFAVWTPCRSHVLEVLKNNNVILKPDISHVDYKSMARTKALLTDAGFEIGKACFAESHLPVLRWAEGLLQRWVPLLRRRIAVLGEKPG